MVAGDIVRFPSNYALETPLDKPVFRRGLLVKYEKWEKVAYILYKGKIISARACDVSIVFRHPESLKPMQKEST